MPSLLRALCVTLTRPAYLTILSSTYLRNCASWVVVLLMWSIQAAQAQSSTPIRSLHDYEVLPPSPTVAALGSYGSIPVSYHTGVPEISIPLYTLAVKGLALPIALSYHSNGLLVDERASNVGLGWNCTGLSVIGHTVMGGLSDFDSGGYCAGAEWHDTPDGTIVNNEHLGGVLYDFSQDILKKTTDVEPDIYNYSFPGHSGKFVFDKRAVAHTIPYECIQIVHHQIGNGEDFVITDESGNRYLFGGGEYSRTFDLTPGCGSPDAKRDLNGTTAFYLHQIITPYHDTINFSYQATIETYLNPLDLTEYEFRSVDTGGFDEFAGGCDNISPRHDCIRQTEHITQFLTKIQCNGESIEFTYDANRQDLAGGRRLNGVLVRYGNEVRKEFRLYHSYFEASTASPITDLLAAPDKFRLRLDSVQQVGLPAYRFTYNLPNSLGFPPVHGYAQDRWGYYNQRLTNPTLVVRKNNLGANRDSDSLAVKVGMLRQITYPTGGRATFTYEANTLYHPARLLDELENVSGLFVLSPDQHTVRADTSFTITGDSARYVSITFRFPNPASLPPNPDGTPNTGSTITGGSAFFTLSNANGTELYRAVSGGQFDNITAPIVLKLLPGHYYLSGGATGGADFSPGGSGNTTEYWGQLLLRTRRLEPAGNQVVGGCRIRQVEIAGRTAYGPVGVTRYVYTDSLGHVSSYALTLPQLTSKQLLRHVKQHNLPWGDVLTVNVDCTYDVNLQSSANQVGMIAGNAVGYTRVTKLLKQAQGELPHKSIYYYNQVEDINPYGDSYPFPPPMYSFDWFRGKLIREQEYNSSGNSYYLVREKRYTYWANYNAMRDQPYRSTPYPNQTIIPAYRVSTIMSGQTNSGTLVGTNEFKTNLFVRYYYVSASVFLTQTAETIYDAQQRPQTTVKQFDYSHDNLLVTRERARTSTGDTLVKHTLYYLSPALVPSGTTNPQLLALQQQQQQHILNQPWEKVQYLYRVGQAPLALPRSLTLYQLVHNTVVPLREYTSQGGTNVTVPFSYVDPARDSLRYDASYYPVVAHQRYDVTGAIQQQVVISGRPVTYLYGYAPRLLTAHALNTGWRQLASTSFEEAATGRWVYDSTGTHRVLGGRTGRWAYQLDGTASVRRGQLPAGEYELTYWVQASSTPLLTITGGNVLGTGPQLLATAPDNWHQFRVRLQVRATGRVSLDQAPGGPVMKLDEVRLYPVGAQVTSYTHDPLVGMTSQTGPDGRTIFYEYDGLGRLVRTRDEQGRILSQQQYHYAGAK